MNKVVRLTCIRHGRLAKSDIARMGERFRCRICKNAWTIKNHARLKKQRKKYYAENCEAIKKKQAIYYQKNKEYYAMKKREYRARDRSSNWYKPLSTTKGSLKVVFKGVRKSKRVRSISYLMKGRG